MGIFGRLFRKRSPVTDVRGRCGAWRRGDLAVCISDDWRPAEPRIDPRRGDVLRVATVVDTTNHAGLRAIFLMFDGKPSFRGWCALSFRKAALDHHAADARFAARIRRLGRAPVGESEPV